MRQELECKQNKCNWCTPNTSFLLSVDLLAVHCHTGWARNCHKHAKCQSCRMVQTDGVTVKVFDYRNPRRPVEIWQKRCLPCGKLLLSKRTVSEHEFRKSTHIFYPRGGAAIPSLLLREIWVDTRWGSRGSRLLCMHVSSVSVTLLPG